MHYCGESYTLSDGNKKVYGQRGEVRGLPSAEYPDYIFMQFPGNKGLVACYLNQLSRDPPVRVGCVWGVKSGVQSGVNDPLGSCLDLAACVSCGCGRR